jgi:sterol desaturase/sphingolipid hydroxylase (fatty acid hydroxylase superfamily)
MSHPSPIETKPRGRASPAVAASGTHTLSQRASWAPRLAPLAVLGAFAALVVLEQRRPLRAQTESALRRNLRNLAVAGISVAVLRLLQKPLTDRATAFVERRRFGLLARASMPSAIKAPLALMLMDYTLYIWHVLTHRVSWIWRFHRIHHLDRDLSASTALRFHFAELALSIPWRVAQILLIGIGRRTFALWQQLLLLSILFHHANLRLPRRIERRLVRFIVTPRMHGIHHSNRGEEVHSNWSSGLTLWDRLHGTLRLDVPQHAITIGVPDQTSADTPDLRTVLMRPLATRRPARPLSAGPANLPR